MAREVVRGAVMTTPGSTAIWKVPASMVTSAVLLACGRPTWIRWPPIMIAPRTDTRRLACRFGQSWRLGGSGACSAQRGAGLLGDGAGNGADQGAAGQNVSDRAVQPQGDARPSHQDPRRRPHLRDRHQRPAHPSRADRLNQTRPKIKNLTRSSRLRRPKPGYAPSGTSPGSSGPVGSSADGPRWGWHGRRVADDFCGRYGDLLAGSYDCVDRIVLNAYFSVGHNPGGFRCWWRRLHGGSDGELDNTHLMRFAGRFARRVKAWAAANGVPVIYCTAGERKHRIAEERLAAHPPSGPGVFLVLAAKAPATVWKVKRSPRGNITSIEKKAEYVYHYSFHIMDPEWGHMTVKMSGHPPFAAQVILNGHEYVARRALAAGIGFVKEGNCFTGIADPQRLAQVADALPRQAAIGRLGQVCERWIYSACLCFGLDLDEQARSGFRYGYSVYQAEYSRNLLFASGAKMEDLFERVCDRTRSRLDIPALRRLFGLYAR